MSSFFSIAIDASKRNYSDSLLETLTHSELVAVTAWYPGLTLCKSQKVRDMCTALPPTGADKAAARTIKDRGLKANRDHLQPDDAVKAGFQINYEPQNVVVTTPSGVQSVRPNCPIPVRSNYQFRQASSQRLAVFVNSVIRITKGEFVPDELKNWTEIYPLINHSKVIEFASLLCTFFSKTDRWVALHKTTKTAISGVPAMSLVFELLDALPEVEYEAIVTYLFFHVFRAVERSGDKWVHPEYKGKPIVPRTAYKLFPLPAEYLPGFAPLGLGVLVRWVGDYYPVTCVRRLNPTLQDALVASRAAREFLGSDKASRTFLSFSTGFSALPTSVHRRWDMCVSMSLSAMVQGFDVDLVVEHVGDFPVLYSSLEHGLKELKETEMIKKDSEVSYRFLVSGLSIPPVTAAVRACFVHVPRPKSAIVFYASTALPSAQKKGETIDYDEHSRFAIPPVAIDAKTWMGLAPIYGAQCWGDDKDVLKSLESRSSKLSFSPLTGVKVSKYGNSSYFEAVVTKGMAPLLVGKGPRVTPTGHDMTQTGWHTFPLVSAPTRSAWYDIVIKSASAAYYVPFNSSPRYSPISNLLYVSTEVALMTEVVEIAGQSFSPDVQASRYVATLGSSAAAQFDAVPQEGFLALKSPSSTTSSGLPVVSTAAPSGLHVPSVASSSLSLLSALPSSSSSSVPPTPQVPGGKGEGDDGHNADDDLFGDFNPNEQ